MKKILMTLAAVLCCAMTTTVFTACGSDDDSSTPEGMNASHTYDFDKDGKCPQLDFPE